MKIMRYNIIIVFLFIMVLASCKKENSSLPDTSDKYFPKVKVIIQTNCTTTCHSPAKGLNQGLPVILDNDSDIVSRAVIIQNAVAGPFNIRNKQMPLGGQLSVTDIDTIKKWVEKGGRASD